MRYLFDPIDNFFFRSAVPFEAGGETTTIASLFPPLPSVYAGALRPYLADPAGGARRLKIGLNGLYLNGQFLFPQPLDMYPDPTEPTELDEGDLCLKAMGLTPTPLSSYPLPWMPTITTPPATKSKQNYQLYLPAHKLTSYLQGAAQIAAFHLTDQYLCAEPQLGIAINPATGTAQDKMIYQLTCQRPQNGLQLGCEAQGLELTSGTIVPLGGEGKLATIHTSADTCTIGAPPTDISQRFFKLYLATPAIFANGWLPRWINPQTYQGCFAHRNHCISVKLLSACIGRPVPCGSFGTDPQDQQRKPREMRYAVPAGSVYYFQITGERDSLADAIRLFHQKCISDYREGLGFDYEVFTRTRYCDRGFGYALVGLLTPEQLQEVSHAD